MLLPTLASQYAALQTVNIGEGEDAVGAGAVLQDMEETMYDTAHFVQNLHITGVMDTTRGLDERVQKTIQEASKGITEGTDNEYRRLMQQCEQFVHKHNMIPANQLFFSQTPHPESASCIIAWILDKCDEVDLDGKTKNATTVRQTYNHAQKMRAAATYGFGRLHGCGNVPWRKSELTGSWVGNPSVFEAVSTYMLSLRRRKVRAGETPTSARALTAWLYEYNIQPALYTMQDYDRNHPLPGAGYCGPRGRRLLNLAYSIAFVCLLRIDEVLRIEHRHVTLLPSGKLEINLDYRKTSQHGDILPFILPPMPLEMQHLCVVSAYAEWVRVTNLVDGYVFRKLDSYDRIIQTNEAMSAEVFLEMFRCNLLDIYIDPAAYGTHSFRRGGCQWLSVHLHWHLRQICEWGGWSTEFSNLTIVKYLISWNDNPTLRREDFFDFNRPPAVKCHACGRSCHCA